METSFASTVFGTEAFQSVAMELMIFCATIAVAVVVKVASFNSSCSPGFRAWLSSSKASANSKSACQEQAAKCPPSPAKPSVEAQVAEQPSASASSSERLDGSTRKASARAAAQGPARIVETIMDRASNKNAAEALALYSEMRADSRHLQMKELVRYSTRHSAIDVYAALVQSAVRAGRPQLVESLLEDMVAARIERTLSFYESAMKVLAGKKYYQQALAVYNRLTSEGLKASPVTMSCLINFYAELGELDRAINLFDQLSATSTPSIRAYMTALRVHSKRQDWNKSLEIFRSMQAKHVPVDSLILNTILATGVAAGKGEAVEYLLHEVSKTHSGVVDVISYNTVLKGFAHQKTADKALKILNAMLERGVRPNGITFNTVMDAAVRCSQIDDAWKVLDQMQESGIQPDKYTCTILMKGLHEDSTPKQLSKVLDMLQLALPQCDSALCASLFRGIIQVAARLNNTALMMRAFNHMLVQHVLPTATDHQLMIQTLAQQGSSAHCMKIWRHVLTPVSDCQQSPEAAAVAIFTAVMEELAKRERVEGMICALESLRAAAAAGSLAPKDAGPPRSQKSIENDAAQMLEQCRAALMQAASRKQHSSPAFRRLLELAPEHGLPLDALNS